MESIGSGKRKVEENGDTIDQEKDLKKTISTEDEEPKKKTAMGYECKDFTV